MGVAKLAADLSFEYIPAFLSYCSIFIWYLLKSVSLFRVWLALLFWLSFVVVK